MFPDSSHSLESTKIAPAFQTLLVLLKRICFAGSAWGIFSLFYDPGRTHWAFELPVHFSLHYFTVLMLFSFWIALNQGFKTPAVWICLLFGMSNLVNIWPYFVRGNVKATRESHQIPLRALVLNIWTHNKKKELVIKFIETEKPDFIQISEFSSRWRRDLKPIEEKYPHQLFEPRDDNFGMGFYSRFPFQGQIYHFGSLRVPSIEVNLKIKGRELAVFGVHPPPPRKADYTEFRNDYLKQLAILVRNSQNRSIVAGDFNATSWSPVFKKFLDEADLFDPGKDLGYLWTWPTFFPPVLIPLDHFLVSDKIQVIGRRLGPNIGSDHYPLVVDFLF